MSKKQLQKDIRNNEGFIFSDGTCNLQHLLPKAYDLITGYNLRLTNKAWFTKEEILNHFSGEIKPNESLYLQQYHGKIELKDSRLPENILSPYTTWDDIESFFNSIAPNGYYFGGSEGDGACIGWFKYE